MKNIKVILIVFAFLLVGSVVFYFVRKMDYSGEAIFGASRSHITSSQADWSQGTISNIAISEAGYIDIDQITGAKLDLSNADNITCNYQSENEQYLGDGEIDTGYWGGSGENRLQDGWYCEFDLGETKRIVSARVNFETTDKFSPYGFVIHDSINGSDWGVIEDGTLHFLGTPNPPTWYDYPMLNPYEDARYIRIIPIESQPPTMAGYLREFELYISGATATHTTAATQIDGQEGSANKDLIEWETFTPTQTTPASTSISYQFRTSADGATWSDWSISQEYSGTPLDLTALTPSRYIQVESTLSTTDVAATPQISDYTINFHNNEAPNQPTAQTAVIE